MLWFSGLERPDNSGFAGITQRLECHPYKVEVAGSNPALRTIQSGFSQLSAILAACARVQTTPGVLAFEAPVASPFRDFRDFREFPLATPPLRFRDWQLWLFAGLAFALCPTIFPLFVIHLRHFQLGEDPCRTLACPTSAN